MAVQRSEDAGKVTYEIKVMGSLDADWSEYFDGLSVVVQPEDSAPILTTVTGRMDQAALRDILGKIRDRNLLLVSVLRCEQ